MIRERKNPYRVAVTYGTIIQKPARSRRRRRCDGHLRADHWIEAGELAVRTALPPNSEIGNFEWWHHTFCLDCAPSVYTRC